MSAFTGDTLPTLPFKHQDMPDRPNDIFPSTLAFKQALDSSTVALQNVHNALIANLQDAGAASGASLFLGAAPVAGVTGATIYDQIVNLRALIQSIIGGVIPPQSITTAMIQDGAVTPPKLNGDSAYWYGLTTNVGNAYSVSIVPAPTAYYAGLTAKFKVNANSSGAVTLNVNGLGAVNVLSADGTAVDDLTLNSVYTAVYNGTAFILQGKGGALVTYTNYQQFFDQAMQFIPTLQLTINRSFLSAASVGNFALLAGGSGNNTAAVEAYNTSLSRSLPTQLSVPRDRLAGVSMSNYALFGGGFNSSGGAVSAVVDAYDTALNRTTPTVLSVARQELAGTTVGVYGLFGGGFNGSGSVYYATVDAYDATLVRTTPTVLSLSRSQLAATSVGNFALFSGGGNGNQSAVVDAYDTALVRTIPTVLSVARSNLAATKIGNYALFGGGGAYSAVIDAYDTSLVRTAPTVLSVPRSYLAAASIPNVAAIFAGGRDGSTNIALNPVESYDTSLVRTVGTPLSTARFGLAAARVGIYVVLGGGTVAGGINSTTTVEAYTTISPNSYIPVTAGSKYNFGGGEVTAPSSTTLKIPAPATGYVKYKTGVIT